LYIDVRSNIVEALSEVRFASSAFQAHHQQGVFLEKMLAIFSVCHYMSEALQPAVSSIHVMNQSDRDCRRVFLNDSSSSPKIVVFVAVDGCSSDGRQTWMLCDTLQAHRSN